MYGGTTLTRKRTPLGPYCRPTCEPKAPRWSWGGGAVFCGRGTLVKGLLKLWTRTAPTGVHLAFGGRANSMVCVGGVDSYT